MDERVKILINKREKLKWTIKKLAEKADLPYGEVLHFEKGNYTVTYFAKLIIALDKGLYAKKMIKKLPSWSHKHDNCVMCGTTEEAHKARGLCVYCYDRDIEKKQKSHKRKRGIASKILTKEYLIKLYLIDQRSLNDIAKECCCTRQFVYKKMKEFKIPTRSKKAARDLAYKKGKIKFERIDDDGNKQIITLQKNKYNESFFSEWSPGMAYVLGFIYSDGTLSPAQGGRLTITQKESEILYKLLKLMDCDAKVIKRKRKEYKKKISGEVYFFHLTNPAIYYDLVQFGLTPDKSLSVNFPEIPQEYIRHFIRGCWDGDGSVYIEKRKRIIKASYISGAHSFIKGLANELEKAGLSRRRIYIRKGKNPSYYFRYSGSECKKLYHYLYDNVAPEQYLQRKYEVFNEYFDVELKGSDGSVYKTKYGYQVNYGNIHRGFKNKKDAEAFLKDLRIKTAKNE